VIFTSRDIDEMVTEFPLRSEGSGKRRLICREKLAILGSKQTRELEREYRVLLLRDDTFSVLDRYAFGILTWESS